MKSYIPSRSISRSLLMAIGAAALSLPASPTAHADHLFWHTPADGDLSTATAWSPEMAPTSNDNLYFEESGSYTITTSAPMEVRHLEARGDSGTVTFNFSNGTVRVGATGISPFVVNQDTLLAGGKLEATLQLGLGKAGKTLTLDGANTEISASGGQVGRSVDAATGSNNTLLIRNGAHYSSTISNAIIIGSNTSQAQANGNNLTVTGAGSRLTSTGGVIVGNLGSGTSGAQASNNKFIVTDGGSATIGSLLTGRRSAGSLLTANGNTVEVGGGSGNSVLNIAGVVSIGGAGRNNTLTVREGGTIQATGGGTTLTGRTGNALHVAGGTYDATGQTINAGAEATIGLRDNGTLKAGTIILASTAQFGYANNGSAAFSSGHLQTGSLMAEGISYNFSIGSNLSEETATYEMTGNGLHHFNNGLTVTTKGRLTGSGNINTGSGSLTNQGVIGSLEQVTTITLAGALTSGDDAVYEFFIQDAATYSRIVNEDNMRFNGTLKVALGQDYTPILNTTFDLFDSAAMSGEFINVELPTLGHGLMWDTSNLTIDGTISVIPEGRTYSLLISGIVLAVAAGKRLKAVGGK